MSRSDINENATESVIYNIAIGVLDNLAFDIKNNTNSKVETDFGIEALKQELKDSPVYCYDPEIDSDIVEKTLEAISEKISKLVNEFSEIMAECQEEVRRANDRIENRADDYQENHDGGEEQ